jgi:hypothetical protein
MMRKTLLALLALCLAACAGQRPLGTQAPAGGARIPSGSIELGDWARGSEQQVARRFADTIAQRYGPGLALSAAAADLRSNQFTCAANRDRRGDPPDLVCRRSIQGAGCIHTWQVHLFSDGAAQGLTRTRGLYDRSCSRDQLLGGPR